MTSRNLSVTNLLVSNESTSELPLEVALSEIIRSLSATQDSLRHDLTCALKKLPLIQLDEDLELVESEINGLQSLIQTNTYTLDYLSSALESSVSYSVTLAHIVVDSANSEEG